MAAYAGRFFLKFLFKVLYCVRLRVIRLLIFCVRAVVCARVHIYTRMKKINYFYTWATYSVAAK